MVTEPEIVRDANAASVATTNAATNSRYASNREDLAALQRQRLQSQRAFTAILTALVIIMVFFPSYFFAAMLLAVVLGAISLICGVAAAHQARRAEVVQRARMNG